MTDKPWEHQPPPPPQREPSRIILPTSTITITVDNRGPAPRVTMQCSTEMAKPFVIGVFSSLIQQLSGEMMQAMMGAIPETKPDANPAAGRGPNGKT